MILLDTNFLIRSLIKDSQEASWILQWMKTDQRFVTSSLCWYEFLCGPVNDQQIALVSNIIEKNFADVTQATSTIAAKLWNSIGRNRNHRFDSLIAASAIEHNFELATSNLTDFKLFQPYGLKLVNEFSS